MNKISLFFLKALFPEILKELEKSVEKCKKLDNKIREKECEIQKRDRQIRQLEKEIERQKKR